MLHKLKNSFLNNKNYFSKSTIALVVIFVILVITVYTICFRKVVKVAIGSKVTSVVTYKSTVKDILEQSKIVLGAKDKVEPGLYTKVKNGQKIYIKRAVKKGGF